jgi:predicted PurR-regulated permease PerM
MEVARRRENPRGLVQTCLGVLFIGALIGTSYIILVPFLPALVWATLIVISTWPLMLATQSRVKNRRSLAAAIMVLGLFLVFIVPLFLAANTIVEGADELTSWAQSMKHFERPPPPEWLDNVPIVGPRLAERWTKLAATNKDDLIARLSPYMGDLTRWFVAQVGNVGMLVIHFLLTLILSAVLYINGEKAAEMVRRFAVRLADDRGEESVKLAAQAIRAVAIAVVGTALIQSLFAFLGFSFAGVPQAVLLTAVCFFFAVIQIGAAPVMILVIIWLYFYGSMGALIWVVCCTIVVSGIDNIIRPLLIRRGADLPLLLIFAGVVGGLIAFGIIGLFIGPVVLAVTYTLLGKWVAETHPAAAQ